MISSILIIVGSVFILTDYLVLSDEIKTKIPKWFDLLLIKFDQVPFKDIEISLTKTWIAFFGTPVLKKEFKLKSIMPFSAVRQPEQFQGHLHSIQIRKVEIRKIKLQLTKGKVISKRKYLEYEELIKQQTRFAIGFNLQKIFILFPFASLVFYVFSQFFFTSNVWFLGTCGFPILFKFLFDVVNQAKHEGSIESYNNYRLKASAWYSYLFFSALLSTLVIVLINTLLDNEVGHNFIFEKASSNWIIPKYPLLYTFHQSLFMILPIYFSLMTISHALIKNKTRIWIFGSLNILVSLLIGIIYYLLLSYLREPDSSETLVHLENSINHLIPFLNFSSPDNSGQSLLPSNEILLTQSVFIPISLYMVLFLILSFSKIMLNSLSYLLKRIKKGDETIVSRIGSIIVTSVVLVRTIIEISSNF